MSVNIFWTCPEAEALDQNYSRIKIFRASSEQSQYQEIAEIDSRVNNIPQNTNPANLVQSFEDLSGSSNLVYYVRYFDPINLIQTGIVTAFLELTPKEVRLITQLKTWLPPVLARTTSDNDLRNALHIALYNFNIYAPETDIMLSQFPTNYEGILLMQSQITIILYKYLGVAIRDFSYSDNGLALTIDRGAKMQIAIDKTMALYNELIDMAKKNYMSMGGGIGTTQLMTGMGGNIPRGSMNVLDIFQSLGR